MKSPRARPAHAHRTHRRRRPCAAAGCRRGRDSARNPGGGDAGVGIGVGLAVAQQITGSASQAFKPTAAPAAGAAQPPALPSGPPPIPQMAFFMAEAGKPVGPLGREALEQRVREGKLRADTLVWRDGMANWLPASQVAELTDVLSTAPAS